MSMIIDHWSSTPESVPNRLRFTHGHLSAGEDPPGRSSDGVGGRPVTRKWWTLGGAGVLLLVLGFFGLLDRLLERTLRAPVNDYLRDRTLTLLHAEGPSGLTITLPHVDLKLVRRRLDLRNVRIRYAREREGRTTRFEAVAPGIVLSGVGLADLIWHRTFRLSGVRIDSLVMRHTEEGPPDTTPLTPAATPDDTLAAVFPAPDTLLYRVVANWLPTDVREGRVGRLSVNHATFVNRIHRGAAVTFDSTADLSLVIEKLELDSARFQVFERGVLTVASHTHVVEPAQDSVVVERVRLAVDQLDTAYTVGAARTGPGGNRHVLRLVGLARSQARNTLTIDSLLYAPRTPAMGFFRDAPARSTRVMATMTGITLTGFRQDEIRNRRVAPERVAIATLELDVLADHRRPPNPERRRVPWPARVATLPWTFGADTVILAGGSIRYAELPPESPRTAEMVFGQVRATLTNATNDTARVGARTPMVIRAEARLYGRGRLETVIAVAVQPGPLSVRVNGHLGAMPLAPLNRFLTPGEGIEITSGEVQRADFAFRVRHGLATGTFTANYHDLDLSVVDPATGAQNVGARIKTLLAGLMVRGSNTPDKNGALSSAEIHYNLLPGDTFWGTLWRALRSGIVKQVKR